VSQILLINAEMLNFSSSIEQLLGYCESEHVVDSITLFV
jgi:hypothetical protein